MSLRRCRMVFYPLSLLPAQPQAQVHMPTCTGTHTHTHTPEVKQLKAQERRRVWAKEWNPVRGGRRSRDGEMAGGRGRVREDQGGDKVTGGN